MAKETIGSQNLTPAGNRNHEVSAGITSAKELSALESRLQAWCESGRALTLEEISDIEEVLGPIEEQADVLRKEIAAEQKKIGLRREERRRQLEVRQKALAECVSRVELLGPNGCVARETAESFVAVSGVSRWNRSKTIQFRDWLARYVVGPAPDWRFDLKPGGTTHKFLVARAISRCARRTVRFLRNPGLDVKSEYAVLLQDIRRIIRSAVANSNGVEYEDPYGDDPEYVWLGINGFSVNAFIREFLTRTTVIETIRRLKLLE